MCSFLRRNPRHARSSSLVVRSASRIAKVFVAVLLLLSLLNPSSARPALAASVVLDPTGFSSLGALAVSNGQTASFNTDTGTWTVDVEPAGTGGVVDANSTNLTAFTFDSIVIESGAIVTYSGSHALALLSKGDVTITGTVYVGGLGSDGGGGLGAGGPGYNASGGGGAGFGGSGGQGGQAALIDGGLPGVTYLQQDLSLEPLFPVGSGGGGIGGVQTGGGEGGGGIAIFALGIVSVSGEIIADGEPASITEISGVPGPGGGSGGAILLVTPSLTAGYSISARGGYGISSNTSFPLVGGGGGGGGGGRVTIITDSPTFGGTVYVTGGPAGDGDGGGSSGEPGSDGTQYTRAFTTLTTGIPRKAGASIPLTTTLTIGSGSSFVWDFGDGITTTTGVSTTNHAYTAVGPYDLHVTVTMAGSGATATGTTTITVDKGEQTITFDPLENRALTASPFTVSASTSSGIAISFTADGTCTVLGDQVTLTGTGLCTITAHQAGDANYNAALDVSRSFNVIPPVYLPLIKR